LGGKYKTEHMSIGVARKEIYSNQIAFDGKKRNYSNKLYIDYKLTHSFTPYVEVADVYVDKNTDERQARYRVGFKYKF
ncbi:oligogalacturonate-specific porin KdgM family protein, partial [Pseudomonas lundensis]|uniref:oligogalacturonate-specific porin KdgM family protein n=3 Tax=Pseudomonas TaxID=286 RepID=UPI003FCFEF82